MSRKKKRRNKSLNNSQHLGVLTSQPIAHPTCRTIRPLGQVLSLNSEQLDLLGALGLLIQRSNSHLPRPCCPLITNLTIYELSCLSLSSQTLCSIILLPQLETYPRLIPNPPFSGAIPNPAPSKISFTWEAYAGFLCYKQWLLFPCGLQFLEPMDLSLSTG